MEQGHEAGASLELERRTVGAMEVAAKRGSNGGFMAEEIKEQGPKRLTKRRRSRGSGNGDSVDGRRREELREGERAWGGSGRK